MSNISIFDIIGPNMVGPSSSHTAGAVKIARTTRKIFEKNIKKVTFVLYGSFAKTYKGHGTDRALLGGIMGFKPDDLRIQNSFEIADSINLEYSFIANNKVTDLHPNTVDIYLEGEQGEKMLVRGVSIGGGEMKIDSINNVKMKSADDFLDIIDNF